MQVAGTWGTRLLISSSGNSGLKRSDVWPRPHVSLGHTLGASPLPPLLCPWQPRISPCSGSCREGRTEFHTQCSRPRALHDFSGPDQW